ncbi:hypothetical protein [Patulibacter minatonensis]|uniref:hypothetical protein n=1 Tax=Patulibacter minatonensis TaxID=298163 RepID=UPI00047E393E|nr:hypothetical protein [Patulibacter minatonensis]
MLTAVPTTAVLPRAGIGSHHFSSHSSGSSSSYHASTSHGSGSYGGHHYYGSGHGSSDLSAGWIVLILVAVAIVLLVKHRDTLRRLFASA